MEGHESSVQRMNWVQEGILSCSFLMWGGNEVSRREREGTDTEGGEPG